MSKDYALTPELGNDYSSFRQYITDAYMMRQGVYKHSEFKDPNSESYEAMDVSWDWPWDDRPPWWTDIPDSYPGTYGGVVTEEPTGFPVGDVTRCNCAGMKIQYTTTTMAPNQSQTLILTGITNQNLCDAQSITWTLSGSGHIYPYDGFHTTFTASSSASCTGMSTITATCWGVSDSVSIATSSNTWGNDMAYTIRTCMHDAECWPSGGFNCATTFIWGYNCLGQVIKDTWGNPYCGCGGCSSGGECTQEAMEALCDDNPSKPCFMKCETQSLICLGCPSQAGTIGSMKDMRTEEMMANCCPAIFF